MLKLRQIRINYDKLYFSDLEASEVTYFFYIQGCCGNTEAREQLSKSQSLTWVPRIQPRLSVLVASTFTYRTNLMTYPETL